MPFIETAPPAALLGKPKTQNEGEVKYTLKNSYRLGRVEVTASGVCTWTADSEESIPAGDNTYYLFGVAVFPLGGVDVTLTISGNKGGSGLVNGYMTLTGTAIYDDSFIATGGANWNSISGVTCSGGTANDLIDIYAIPDPDEFTLLAYVRTWELARGDHMIPVPDGFDPQATTVRQRRENSFSIGKDYVDPDALTIIRGRECTVMIEIHPGGLSTIQEYIIFPKAAVSTDISSPDNAMVTSTASGGARDILSYEPSG